MHKVRSRPKVLINGSAIGFYGTSKESEFDEDSHSGEDFLARLCKKWETIATGRPSGTRLLIIRIGIVLEKDGGAMGKMLPIFRSGFGGPLGDGLQWMSWIHRYDLCSMIEKALKNDSWAGKINGVSPSPVSMSEFSKTLGKALHRPSLFPVPGAILRLLLGDGAKVVLEGQKVSSFKLDKLKFTFKYTNILDALRSITEA